MTKCTETHRNHKHLTSQHYYKSLFTRSYPFSQILSHNIILCTQVESELQRIVIVYSVIVYLCRDSTLKTKFCLQLLMAIITMKKLTIKKIQISTEMIPPNQLIFHQMATRYSVKRSRKMKWLRLVTVKSMIKT